MQLPQDEAAWGQTDPKDQAVHRGQSPEERAKRRSKRGTEREGGEKEGRRGEGKKRTTPLLAGSREGQEIGAPNCQDFALKKNQQKFRSICNSQMLGRVHNE